MSNVLLLPPLQIHPVALRLPGGWWRPEPRRSHVSQRTALIFSFTPTPGLVSTRQLGDEDSVSCYCVHFVIISDFPHHLFQINLYPPIQLLMSRGCGRGEYDYHAVASGEESGVEQSKVKVNRCEDTSKEYRRWKADTLAKQVHPCTQLGISQETACSKVKIPQHYFNILQSNPQIFGIPSVCHLQSSIIC